MQDGAELRSSLAMGDGRPTRWRALVRALLLTASGLAGCDEKPTLKVPHDPPGLVASVLSRSAAPQASQRSVPPVESAELELARKEILAHVPSAVPAPEGSTRLGTETVPPSASEIPSASAAPSSVASAPHLETHVSLVSRPARSAPAVERLLRATVYFALVNRCRDDRGQILPPEAVTLGFELDATGSVVDGSIKALPKDPKHEAAAECMIRELAASGFRAPPATRGESTTVSMPVPTVD
jgi:hypothetical protein